MAAVSEKAKAHARAYLKRYYAANRERLLLQQKEYRTRNQERVRATNSRSYRRNKAKRKKQNADWYLRNKDRQNAISQERYRRLMSTDDGRAALRKSARRAGWVSQGMDPLKAEALLATATRCEICGEKRIDRSAKKDVGVSQAQFPFLGEKRKERSAPPANLVPDHDHHTGEIRGVLCKKCNHGIGLLGESAGIALSASRYLQRHRRKGGDQWAS